MATSFYFYDLETSSVDPRTGRIMQFAGQRTDMNLQPVGDPHNILIALPDDVVPDPGAILVTGITPQQTLQDGITEAEFLRIFQKEIAVPGTIFVGFNTVRFDDEFMRYLHYRNFYDPYEWQYLDQKSRWDLLDLVRMTRALRPEGITWPVDDQGKPTNRLELITKANDISHEAAHDALSDVYASIAVAKLIQDKQPKLFEYSLNLRDKKAVEQFIQEHPVFVYSSGKYPAEYEKTAVVSMLARHPMRQAALVYDLRHDPAEYVSLTPQQLVGAWTYVPGEGIRLPIKTMQFNRCPAVAPVGVVNDAAKQRLTFDIELAKQHAAYLRQHPEFVKNVLTALEIMDEKQAKSMKSSKHVDAQLYDSFIQNNDKRLFSRVRTMNPEEIQSDSVHFEDRRLNELLPLYKARNFRSVLSDEERAAWEQYRSDKLMQGGTSSELAVFFAKLGELAASPDLTADKQYLLEELQLYGQSIMPAVID